VFLAQVECRWLIEFVNLAVNPCSYETLGLQIGHKLDMLTLAVNDDRREQHQLAAFGQSHYLIDHLLDGLCFKRQVVVRTGWRTGTRVQKAQVVVNFGDGADRGARIVRG